MIEHIFPYDPRHLQADEASWFPSQAQRWPLAAIALTERSGETTVRVIGSRARRVQEAGLECHVHRSWSSGPRWCEWGDDYSWSLHDHVRHLGKSDICVLHLNGYPIARTLHRAACPTPTILVAHGRGVGPPDGHLRAATAIVVLRDDAYAELTMEYGLPSERVFIARPSVDRSLFRPAAAGAADAAVGFVGRLDASKGFLEAAAVARAFGDVGSHMRVEIVGPGNHRALAEISRLSHATYLGVLDPAILALRMSEWRFLLLPSYSEGSPLVVSEALSCGVPVISVENVLSPELEKWPGVVAVPRQDYVRQAVRLAERGLPPGAVDRSWAPDHMDAALWWNRLYRALGDNPPWEVNTVSTRARPFRLHPVRAACRPAWSVAKAARAHFMA